MTSNSIQEHMDGAEKIPLMGFEAQAQQTYIVVEGQTDVKVLINFVSKNTKVQKFKNGGWNKVQEALDIYNYKWVIGIRDADFINFINNQHCEINNRLFHTDYHDLEMMIISACWQKLYNEFIKRTDIDYLPEINKNDKEHKKENKEENEYDKNSLLELLFNVLIPLSCIRFQNECDVLRLNFEKLRIGEYIDFKNKKFKTNEFISVLNKKSKTKTKEISINDIASLESFILSDNCSQEMRHLYKINKIVFFFYFINGHDFLECCAKWVRQNTERKDVTEEQIASSARTAYTLELFKETKLYKSIKAYSEKNRLSFWKEES